MKTRKLLCFTASWCKPCQNMKPTIERLSKNHPGMVKELDVEIEMNKRAEYGVGAVPTFIVIDGSGAVVDKHIGGCSASKLEAMLNH